MLAPASNISSELFRSLTSHFDSNGNLLPPRAVLVAIALYFNHKLTVQELAEWTGCQERQVWNCLKYLKAHNIMSGTMHNNIQVNLALITQRTSPKKTKPQQHQTQVGVHA